MRFGADFNKTDLVIVHTAPGSFFYYLELCFISRMSTLEVWKL